MISMKHIYFKNMTEVVKSSKQRPNFTFFIKFEHNLGVKTGFYRYQRLRFKKNYYPSKDVPGFKYILNCRIVLKNIER